ncbi:Rossmann-fold NAD(P)-binding domain-containing protein [Mesonia aquimarina]|uniref:NAD(P) transhydrogenase subunit alpha n=1 Tax=Mesonia aquimarina TaxID=1504967 RepID=UPI000EF5B5B1|nr:NAD(P) transhydrogenase subunit alpha [Mesonia aquimarina]
MKHRIGLLKEPAFEKRIALLPDDVHKLINELEISVLVEKDYATSHGITDQDYQSKGAKIKTRKIIGEEATIIIAINPIECFVEQVKSKIEFIGIYKPLFFQFRMKKYSENNVKAYSLDLLPRTTLAQNMDVRSSMDALSGYKAVIHAAELYKNVFPMSTTAAGTLQPVRILVLGAGVAGLQAIATAKRLGAVVHAFDVRKAAGEEVRSLGAKFIEVNGNTETSAAGGYAVTQTETYAKQQKKCIEKQLTQTDIVICTANIPGKKAPVLLEKSSLKFLAKGSIIIDLAAEQGGNCSLTENETSIYYEGIQIYGNSYLSRELPKAASSLLSANFYNYLKFRLTHGLAHELVQTCEVSQYIQ